MRVHGFLGWWGRVNVSATASISASETETEGSPRICSEALTKLDVTRISPVTRNFGRCNALDGRCNDPEARFQPSSQPEDERANGQIRAFSKPQGFQRLQGSFHGQFQTIHWLALS